MPSLNELLITLFLFLTAPVSAHLLIKAALRLEQSRSAESAQAPAQCQQGAKAR